LFLHQHPRMNRTLLRQAFDAEGWQLLYTPPYQCESQPIELLWAYVKNYLGRQMKNDHSVATVTQLTRAGFYGDEQSGHGAADAGLCNRLIEHVHKWCNAFIRSDDELVGTIDAIEDVAVPPDDIFNDMDNDAEVKAALLADSDSSDEEQFDNAL
jgi:hypothetical protein